MAGKCILQKLPEVADLEESEELGYQQTRDRDAEKKQIGADNADKSHYAAKKCVQEGDLVLLEKKKENKLSSHYEKEPYQVTARYGDQVQLKSPQGAEYRRYIQHVKQFVIPDREPKDQQPAGPVAVPSEHALGQEITPSLETGGGASPADGPNQEQLLPRRSGRVTRTPRPPPLPNDARET